MKKIPIALIGLYKRLVSPLIPPRCKYHPTCSQYSIDALKEWGLFRGLSLSAWRLLRCNPFSHGGYDPVKRRNQ